MLSWLKEFREVNELSQDKVAQLVGIGQSGYSMIEIGERRPSVETAKKIASVLGFDWQMFYPDEPGDFDKEASGQGEDAGGDEPTGQS